MKNKENHELNMHFSRERRSPIYSPPLAESASYFHDWWRQLLGADEERSKLTLWQSRNPRFFGIQFFENCLFQQLR